MAGDGNKRPPTTRGRPLKVYQPSGLGCVGGFLLVVFGLGLTIAGLSSIFAEAPLGSDDLAAHGGLTAMGLAGLATGVALSWQAFRTRLLIFDTGFVHRDWRGRERFVPWGRLEAIEIRTSFFAGSGLLSQCGSVVLVIGDDDGQREEILLKREATGLMTSNEPPEEIRELASRAGLERRREGLLSMTREAWRRPEEGRDDA